MTPPPNAPAGVAALGIAGLLLGLTLLIVPIAGLAFASRGNDPVLDPSRPVEGVSTLQATSAPTSPLEVPEPNARTGSLWARVVSPAMARVAPGLDAAPVARLSVRTPEGSPSIVSVLATAKDRVGYAWVRVVVPGLPNGREGWVARTALGGAEVSTTRLTVDTTSLTASLERGGKVVLRVRVGDEPDYEWLMIDASHAKVHPHAAGAKGVFPRAECLGWVGHDLSDGPEGHQ